MDQDTRATAPSAPLRRTAQELLHDEDAAVLYEAIEGLFGHCDEATLGDEIADVDRFYRAKADRAVQLLQDSRLANLTRDELVERYPVLDDWHGYPDDKWYAVAVDLLRGTAGDG